MKYDAVGDPTVILNMVMRTVDNHLNGLPIDDDIEKLKDYILSLTRN